MTISLDAELLQPANALSNKPGVLDSEKDKPILSAGLSERGTLNPFL